ncbi:MAG: T9SS type A sorting domain-containing protein [Muribaculaceae bacterium]|nr:T9SS type A sorting domain-containing protein [Muribaculaceae bacterium]
MTNFYRNLLLCLTAIPMFMAAAEPAGSLQLTLSDVTATDATVTVTPTDVPQFIIDVQDKETYDKNGGDAGAPESRLSLYRRFADLYGGTWQEYAPFQKGIYTNTISDFIDIESGHQYVVYAFGLDNDGNLSAPVVSEIFPQTTEQNFAIDINVTDISQRDARISVTPTDDTQSYMWSITKKEIFENAGGEEGIYENHDMKWWNFVAQSYGVTWQEAAALDVVHGPTAGMYSEFNNGDLLDWDTEYVVYAYAFSDSYAQDSKVFFKEFKTAPADKSDLTFEVSLVEVIADPDRDGFNKATFKIVPSNDTDSYANHMHEALYWDFYDGNPDFTFEDYLSNQVYPYIVSTRKGTQVLTYRNIRPNKEYILVTLGWDVSPTTEEVNMFRFSGKATSGIGDIESAPAAKATGHTGYIHIDGTYEAAAVYTIDGKVVGTYRGTDRIATAPGLYIIRLRTTGAESTHKVIVK